MLTNWSLNHSAWLASRLTAELAELEPHAADPDDLAAILTVQRWARQLVELVHYDPDADA